MQIPELEQERIKFYKLCNTVLSMTIISWFVWLVYLAIAFIGARL